MFKIETLDHPVWLRPSSIGLINPGNRATIRLVVDGQFVALYFATDAQRDLALREILENIPPEPH